MANIYYRRKTLTQLLRRELPNEFLVVPNPDHPLLLRGPDLLVAGERATTAVFMPLAAERTNQGLLKARFILSRLALPPYVRCILVAEEKDYSIANSFANDFANILEWNNRAGISEMITDVTAFGHHKDVPPDISGDAQIRFANAMAVMRLSSRLTNRPFSAAFDEKVSELRRPIRSAIRHSKRRPQIDRNSASTEQQVDLSELSDADVNSSTVNDLVYEQANYYFSLDGGIPFAAREPLGIAVIEDWPARPRDSEKLILSAAFGGWAFVLAELRSELPRFAKRMRQGRRS